MPLDFTTYPPSGHQDRIKAYGQYEKLFSGQHRDLYAAKPGPFQQKRYIIANFAGLISRLSADLLFGEQPDFTVPSGAESTQEALNRTVARNRLHTVNYESALSNSFRGDAVYKVRWGLRSPEEEKPEAIIEEVPAAIYFPEVDDDDLRRVTRVTLAWLKTDPTQASVRYLRIEEHEPGIIRNRLLVLIGGRTGEQVPLDTFEAYKGLPEEQETGLKHIPVFHVPNFRYGSRFWGISDYEGLGTLFEATNNRLTQIDEVLDKHVAPKIILPPGFVDEDGKVRFDKLEVIQIEPGAQQPSYLTWEGQLAAAKDQLDRLLDLMFIMSETAPSAFGMDKFGVAESGRALRLRLLRTLAKINRKRLYYDTALKAVLLTAQQLEVAHGGADYEPEEPSVQWADGLPEDMVEMVEMESQRLMAGNTSVESSIRRLDGPEAVEAEMDRIAGEQGQAMALTGALRRGRQGAPALDAGEAGGAADTSEGAADEGGQA